MNIQLALVPKMQKKAGLWGKAGPWSQYPKRMLQMRARSFALRDKFADALSGLLMAEEVQDYSTTVDVTPKTKTLSSKLDELITEQSNNDNDDKLAIVQDNQPILDELSKLIFTHNIPDDTITKWCNKAGVATINELDSSKIQSCVDHIYSNYVQEKTNDLYKEL